MIKVPEGPDNLFFRSNVMTIFHVITKTKIRDINSIKQQILRNTQGLPEMRSKLIKVFNNFYYKKLSDEEFEKHLDRAISQIPHDFKNEQELIDYIAANQIKDLPRESIQYRIMVKLDFNSEQSAVVLVYSHGMSDGVGTMNMFCALQDEFDPSNLPYVRQRSLQESIKRYAACIIGIYFHLKNYPQKYRDSELSQRVEKQKTQITISKDMKIDELKQKICRRFGCSINDLLIAASILSMRDYCLANNIKDYKIFEGFMAVNQRSQVVKKSDFRLFNRTFAHQIRINIESIFSFKVTNLCLEQQFKETLRVFTDQIQCIKTNDLGLSEFTAMRNIAYLLPDIVIEKRMDKFVTCQFQENLVQSQWFSQTIDYWRGFYRQDDVFILW
ncbi:UNKNOWN [Stylonychia lemnae]|uniref:Diacylglycerol O-acyltransferase n=1 Tax=Stylonychia lemnae TaxID=5949 RepID=A0A078A2P8_STYLE|nr:UNKNOWN [Stylonychia lemnae]|eukprot:CDW76102.1 UNKNOWN [Stylonychia lemnae]